MASVLKELHDKRLGYYPRSRKTSGQMEAYRFFLIDTGYEPDTYSATGLPAYGAAHSSYSSLLALDFDPIVLSLGAPSTGADGRTVMQVTYRSPTADWSPGDTAEAGDAFHDMRPVSGQQTINFDQAGARIDPISIESHTVELLVYAYVTGPNYASYRASALDLMNPVPSINEANVIIPALRNGIGGFTAAAEQLLYRNFEVRPLKDGVIEMIHHLGIAPAGGWVATQRAKDKDGNFVGTATEHDVYRTETFPTLW